MARRGRQPCSASADARFSRHLAVNLEQVIATVRATGGTLDRKRRLALVRAEGLVVKLQRDAQRGDGQL